MSSVEGVGATPRDAEEVIHRTILDGIADPNGTPLAARVVAALSAEGWQLTRRADDEALRAALHKWSCGVGGHSLDCQAATPTPED